LEIWKGLPIKFKIVLYIAIFSLIIFQGCVTKEAVKNVPDEVILRERVKTYWEYKINQEFDKSYEFEAPIYRKKVNLVNYIRGFNINLVRWNGAMIDNIKVESDSAMIDMNLRVKVNLPGIKTNEYNSLIKEKWVKVDGMWYHIPAEFMK
jgi:hypothetical protein